MKQLEQKLQLPARLYLGAVLVYRGYISATSRLHLAAHPDAQLPARRDASTPGPSVERQLDLRRCGEMCGEVWGGVGRCGEVWGDV